MRLSEEEYRALIGGTPPIKPKKAAKYKNERTEIDGHKFDSIKEAEYYVILKDREKKGEIRYLKLQYPVEIQPSFTDKQGKRIRAITYRADFYFYDCTLKSWRIIDVKGFKTDVYLLKKKLLAYKGIYIEEV